MMHLKNFLNIKHLYKSQDAVTEVLDFVTILGILVLSFSIIGVAGYPVLKSAQETRYIENTRQTFVVMADNINKIAVGQTPSQSVEIKMYGGTLKVTMDSRINITAKNSTGQVITLADQQMGSIQNSIGDAVVAYEGTGVWVKYPSGTILNAYKPFIASYGNVLVIPLVRITGNSSIGGNGMSRISAIGTPGVTFYGNVNNITVTITGSYLSGWKDYFTDVMGWSYDTGGNYTARLNASANLSVYILNTQMYTEIK